jgi:hypothetical protein
MDEAELRVRRVIGTLIIAGACVVALIVIASWAVGLWSISTLGLDSPSITPTPPGVVDVSPVGSSARCRKAVSAYVGTCRGLSSPASP